MKLSSAGRFSLLGVTLASMSVFSAAVDTVTVTEGGVAFTVVLSEGTYGLKFRLDGTRSFYTFNSAAQVTSIEVGTETYNVTYDTSDNLESVQLTPSTRRSLSQEESTATVMEGRRLDFEDCTACEDTWDALCAGVSSVCDLVDYGSPLSTTAAASVDTTCETFGGACSSYDASEACQGQCTEAVSSNKCLDPAREEYKCTFSGDTTLVFTGCTLTDEDVPFFQACFEEFGKTNIQELLLDANKLRVLPEGTFAGLSELTILDLYRNKLVTLPEGVFDGLTKLEDLDLAFNDLVSLPEGVFSELESLLKLRLSVNELTPEGLPIGLFSGTPLLQELDLTRNNLRGIVSLVGLFDGLTELIDLGLGECGLQTVPEGLFAGLAKLESLCLYFNRLGNLPDGAFSGLSGLRTLVISSTGVTSVGSSLSGLTELRTLFLEFNDLLLTENAFSGLANLDRLDLEACGLTTLPAGVLSPLVNLATLDLADNGLTNIGSSLSGLTELRTLNLRDNDLLLTEDTFSGLVNLESLDIFSTGLASLPEGFASRLPALTSLNLGSNELLLTGDSFSGLENLEILTLSGNELSNLPEALFSALTALITLNLGGNPLLLAEDIFSGLVNLETLNLGNSGLTTLPAGLFSPLVNMTTLVVSRNTDIQCIPASTATDIVSTFIDLPDGACECTPVEAVFCADGLICQSGMTGYTCVAE